MHQGGLCDGVWWEDKTVARGYNRSLAGSGKGGYPYSVSAFFVYLPSFGKIEIA
ncbi:MAG: hypothetical protein LBU92_01695 [Prevotellaceae bacterium]|nr:hypothetical protein [Prevotellaceae bacterium]